MSIKLFTKSEAFQASFPIGKVLTFAESQIKNKLTEAEIFDEQIDYDIFISHSYLDRVYIEGVFNLLFKKKYLDDNIKYFFDWKDAELSKRELVSPETALNLKEKMKKCKSLFFVTTEHYEISKWMPWELGYFDGLKSKVIILPLVENENENKLYSGQEYLGIYPYLGIDNTNNNLCVFKPGDDCPIENFKNWINPVYHTYISNKTDLKKMLNDLNQI